MKTFETFDAVSYFKDHGIDFIEEGNKHTTRGWISLDCPFCDGSKNYHLGFNLDGMFFNCWRCGAKAPLAVVMALESCGPAEARRIMREYKARPIGRSVVIKALRKPQIDEPDGLMNLNKAAGRYLLKRGFDPLDLARKWGLKSFRHTARKPFAGRIYIPVYQEGRLVAWQARALGDDKFKYMASSEKESAVLIKETVFGIDYVRGDSGIVVEGVFDAMRLGFGAVSLFGIKFTQTQLRILKNKFKTVHILFDPEPVAQKSAKHLASCLSVLGTKATVWNLPSGIDPGDLTPKHAQEVYRMLLG